MSDQEKLSAARLDYTLSYKEAFSRVMACSDAECRLILFGLLMGFPLGEIIDSIDRATKTLGGAWDFEQQKVPQTG